MASALNCPNCGHPADARIKSSKVVECGACGGTIFVEDSGFRNVGEQGEMHGATALLTLNEEVVVERERYLPVGVIRYGYGRGWWDEFWCRANGEGVWISVDEGDVVIQKPLDPGAIEPPRGGFSTGDTVYQGAQKYTVNEHETATCLAYRGELPEAPALGETHRFVNFIGDDGGALSFESWDGGQACFVGRWVDPFEVRTKGGRR